MSREERTGRRDLEIGERIEERYSYDQRRERSNLEIGGERI